MIRRTIRLHVNGRTVLSWWVTDWDRPELPMPDPRCRFQIEFSGGMVMLNGAVVYKFVEVLIAPVGDFHRIEFLFDNSLYVIEYRRESYE